MLAAAEVLVPGLRPAGMAGSFSSGIPSGQCPGQHPPSGTRLAVHRRDLPFWISDLLPGCSWSLVVCTAFWSSWQKFVWGQLVRGFVAVAMQRKIREEHFILAFRLLLQVRGRGQKGKAYSQILLVTKPRASISCFFVGRTWHFVAKTICPLYYPFTPSVLVSKSLIFSCARVWLKTRFPFSLAANYGPEAKCWSVRWGQKFYWATCRNLPWKLANACSLLLSLSFLFLRTKCGHDGWSLSSLLVGRSQMLMKEWMNWKSVGAWVSETMNSHHLSSGLSPFGLLSWCKN